MSTASSTSPTTRKRTRAAMQADSAPSSQQAQVAQQQLPVSDATFVQDQDAADSAEDDDEEGGAGGKDKKAGRRKIKIEFIQDKSRRHITFSKRKAGIMKKAYELSTLTGTQVLLLVVSETGLVYTFTTAKLQPLVTQPEGKNLIQACLNAPHGALPSSMPVGPPLGRSAPQQAMAPPSPAAPNTQSQPGQATTGMTRNSNVPGGLSIEEGGDEERHDDGTNAEGEQRAAARRRMSKSSGANAANTRSPTSPGPNSATQPATAQQGQQQASPASAAPMPGSGMPQGYGPPASQDGAAGLYPSVHHGIPAGNYYNQAPSAPMGSWGLAPSGQPAQGAYGRR